MSNAGIGFGFSGVTQTAPAGTIINAENGLSKSDASTVVLGNTDDGGAGTGSAALNDTRKIDLNGFNFHLWGDFATPPSTGPRADIEFSSGSIVVYGAAFPTSFGSPVIKIFEIQSGFGNEFSMQMFEQQTTGFIEVGLSDTNTFMKWDTQGGGSIYVTQDVQSSPPDLASFNAPSLGATGSLWGRRNVVGGTTDPQDVTPLFNRSIHINDGAGVSDITWNLPGAEVGREYLFAVLVAGTVTIQPELADNIVIEAVTGAAGDPASSNVAGSVIKLTAVTDNTWLATSLTGTWTV